MELYIGGTAQGKKVYVTQVRGIAEARIWDNFEEWFREKLQESAPKSPSPEAESMAYLEKHPEQYRRIARLRRRVSDNYIVSQFCSAFCFCPSCRLHLVIEALTSPRYWRIAAERIWKRLWR